MRLDREILISSSIGATRRRRRSGPLPMECPGAGLSAGFRVREPAPGRDATFPGKPRNPDKCLHAHASCLAQKALSICLGSGRCPDAQSIANATAISPNMPTAMIIFVVVSIVASIKPLTLSST